MTTFIQLGSCSGVPTLPVYQCCGVPVIETNTFIHNRGGYLSSSESAPRKETSGRGLYPVNSMITKGRGLYPVNSMIQTYHQGAKRSGGGKKSYIKF